MSSIRVKSLSVSNYRSFGRVQNIQFPDRSYSKPVSIVGYNNSGKTNLINAIKFGLYESVREETLEIKDFHNKDWNNPPWFSLEFQASIADDHILPGNSYTNTVEVQTNGARINSVSDTCNCYLRSGHYSKKWVIKQRAPIFYINFHSIKEEISTNRTSWGNLKSFLAKHLQKIVESDETMIGRKDAFEQEVKDATDNVIQDSNLSAFISHIQRNYSENLRRNNCVVDFGLPSYEDIFLKMLFKIGLNGNSENLIPLDHFGDGFISMFVMAVIQAIADFNVEDNCLFLFEEPESFLHENHQEYFYKSVLCGLSEKGHQVIYTTHSDRMIDPFDTKGVIRLEMDETNQTIVKYNCILPLAASMVDEDTGEIIRLSRYNEFIKSVEPNLSRILFSRKVILVEGPNDVLVYKHIIKNRVLQMVEHNDRVSNKERFADTFLCFDNIAIVCHFGKSTALYLIELCKHFNIDYFVITDWDLFEPISYVDDLLRYQTEDQYKNSLEYDLCNEKGLMTINWRLLRSAGQERLHFNNRRLEEAIGYPHNDKSSIKIWDHISSERFTIDESILPVSLFNFLGFRHLLLEAAEESRSIIGNS